MNYGQRQTVCTALGIDSDDADQLPGRQKVSYAVRRHLARTDTDQPRAVRSLAEASGLGAATVKQIVAASPKPLWRDYMTAAATALAGD